MLIHFGSPDGASYDDKDEREPKPKPRKRDRKTRSGGGDDREGQADDSLSDTVGLPE